MARHVKVLKLQILRPAGGLPGKELARLFRDVRYRVFRLANLAMSEAYLNFHLYRTGRAAEFKPRPLSELNRDLRGMLWKESEERGDTPNEAEFNRFAKVGALHSRVLYALSKYKIEGLTSKGKWRDVVCGKASLPTFRSDMSLPFRCDEPKNRRLERAENGDVELDLLICTQPYPRVVLKTGKLDGGPRAILERLLANPSQSKDGYRQRCFEIKHDDRQNQWWLYVTYDFPAEATKKPDSGVIVGADLGVACPMFAAVNNGYARLGRRHFVGLAARIRSLQNQVMARRRDMQTGGRSSLSADTARAGHGRKRKLQPIERLEGRIHHAYTTLNHQLSSTLVEFAKVQGAQTIQMEDLSGLQKHLTGTFLGVRWRYHQLQSFIEYKAKEAGILLRKVNPRYTSRRCNACGFIVADFDRAYRDAARQNGYVAKFRCPQCEYEADPDYNAARNLATLDIEKMIEQQCRVQGLDEPQPEGSLTT